jgi:hypothetical protein
MSLRFCSDSELMVLCGALWCSMVLYGALWCSLVLCGALCCVVCVVWCSVVRGDLWCSGVRGVRVVLWCACCACSVVRGARWCALLQGLSPTAGGDHAKPGVIPQHVTQAEAFKGSPPGTGRGLPGSPRHKRQVVPLPASLRASESPALSVRESPEVEVCVFVWAYSSPRPPPSPSPRPNDGFFYALYSTAYGPSYGLTT